MLLMAHTRALAACSTREVEHVLRRPTHHRVLHCRFRQRIRRLITRLTRVVADMAETHRVCAPRPYQLTSFRRLGAKAESWKSWQREGGTC